MWTKSLFGGLPSLETSKGLALCKISLLHINRESFHRLKTESTPNLPKSSHTSLTRSQFANAEMSDSITLQSPLLRLPRELRDHIYVYAFKGFGLFPKSWDNVDNSDENALFHELPGICRANRQLFREATPIFLARDIYSWNTRTSQHLLNLFSQFPGDEATKGIEEFSIYNWTDQGTQIQLGLILKFQNLCFLDVFFSFLGIVDGEPMDKYNYRNEQSLWYDTGLHYEPHEGRSVDEEKKIVAKDTQAFVTEYGLDHIIKLPKLEGLQFQFVASDGGETARGSGETYRHRLCNPLWKWATEKMKEKWGRDEMFVTTALTEDYENVNMMGC